MYLGTGQKRRISSIDIMGKNITLDDSSKWEVSMFGGSAIGWSMGNNVTIMSSGLDYKMTNLSKGNKTVAVKHVAK